MKRNFNIKYQQLLETTLIPNDFSDEMKKSLMKPITDCIHPNIPQKLFRFRRCNNCNIEDFRKDIITVVKPSLFSDKYDSLVYINKKAMIKLLKKSIEPSTLSSFILYIQHHGDVPPICKLIYNQGFCNELVKNALNTDKSLMEYMLSNLSTLNTLPLKDILKISMQFTTNIIHSNDLQK